MVTFLQAILLGIVQGITEWFPISSSGHLVIVQHFLGVSPPVVFDLMLHLGSLLVVLWVFRRDIIRILSGAVKGDRKEWAMLGYLALASVPIAVAGLVFEDQVKAAFQSTVSVGIFLIFTAILLFFSRFPKEKGRHLSFLRVLAMGVGQALAILPGVSRSGATISSGMMLGVRREEAATFAFLMFIPAVIGATIFELPNVGAVGEAAPLLAGIAATVITGWLSLTLLLRMISRGQFHHFAWYCLAVGIIIIAL